MTAPDAGADCPCGGVYVASTRYSKTHGPLACVACFDCGREFPPYGPCCHRYAERYAAYRTYCRKCLNGFTTTDEKARYCTPRCEALAGTVTFPAERAV